MNKINLLHYQTTMTSFMHYLTICTKLQISYVLMQEYLHQQNLQWLSANLNV